MKRLFCIVLALIMAIPLGISFSFAAEAVPEFSLSVELTDSAGKAVTAPVAKGAELTAEIKCTRTDIADDAVYYLRGVQADFDYEKYGLTVTTPENGFNDQIIGSKFEGELAGSTSVVRSAYYDIERIGFEVPKTISLGTFKITVGQDALTAYKFESAGLILYLPDEDIEYLSPEYSFSFSVANGASEKPESNGSSGGSSGGSGTPSETSGTAVTTGTAVKESVSLNQSAKNAYISGYDEDDDGTPELVKPMNNISRAEIAVIFSRLLSDETLTKYTSETNSFGDVPSGEWYVKAVSTLANAGIISGDDADNDGVKEFRPGDSITRAELTVIISKFAEKTGTSVTVFSDTSNHWAKQYIETSSSQGWIKGSDTNGDGIAEFRPGDKVTRAETTAIVNRMLGRSAASPDALPAGGVTFSDNSNTAEWYYIDIQLAANTYQ